MHVAAGKIIYHVKLSSMNSSPQWVKKKKPTEMLVHGDGETGNGEQIVNKIEFSKSDWTKNITKQKQWK